MKIAEERGVGSEEYESVMNNNLHGQTAVVASKNDTLFTPKYHSKTSCAVYTNVVNCVNDCIHHQIHIDSLVLSNALPVAVAVSFDFGVCISLVSIHIARPCVSRRRKV